MAVDLDEGETERADPERSSAEIRQLIRRLDPSQKSGGGHKDRVRRLTRFRNYCEADPVNGCTPEFYDDDIPLLFLGSNAPAAVLDEELVGQNFYGLLQACGTPSSDHVHMLKRSARPAMALLRYLVCDWREIVGHKKVETNPPDRLNPFAFALCSCSVEQLQLMNLEMHIEGDKRGGAMEDACHVIVLATSRHLGDDGETTQPLRLDALLSTAPCRRRFEKWLKSPQASNKERELMTTVAEIARQQEAKEMLEHLEEEDEAAEEGEDDDDDDSIDSKSIDEYDGDVLQAFKRAKKIRKDIAEKEKTKKGKHKKKHHGPAERWEDSDLFKILKAKELLEEKGREQLTVRDSQEAMAERARLEEEKAKALQKDPLGVRHDKEFDLSHIQGLRVDMLVQSLKDLEEEMNEVEQERDKNLNMDKDTAEGFNQKLRNLESQKESLESVLDSITTMGAEETNIASDRSILPIDPNFDPILFLTLVHRNATYDILSDSMDRLSNKTNNQVQQLQNLVRDNFALFARCADGIDVFDTRHGQGVENRMNELETFAHVCTVSAHKSFNPLLDNTNNVRKVQSALTVLRRVAPILQAPYLMRQHLENGRFSEALKAYRRVLVIDDRCNVTLLNHVKAKAAEAAREARQDLEHRLSLQKVSLSLLLDGIRDLSELLELEVPDDPNSHNEEDGSVGVCVIGDQTIRIRDHPPALACLLLQAAHFKGIVQKTIEHAEQSATRIFEGESLQSVQDSVASDSAAGTSDTVSLSKSDVSDTASKASTSAKGNQWKYDVLDGRVLATVRAVDVVRNWLPRLLHVGTAAREDEKRRAARVGRRNRHSTEGGDDNNYMAYQVFLNKISPSVGRVVEHAAFCALGSSSKTGGSKEIKETFGRRAPTKLKTLLKSPLPPTQSSKCAKELAELVQVVGESSSAANGLRPNAKDVFETYTLSPLDDCKTLAEEAVVTVEKRRCIFAFDVCARTCASRASGSGRFDGEALLSCLRTLSEELTRPDECASEVEKGCELVVRRCCEGLASYVRDRGDSARLRAVAECAEALSSSLNDVVREVDYMGGHSGGVEEVMEEDVTGLEGAMFDEYLENVRDSVNGCTHIGWLDVENTGRSADTSVFPSYLSSSLLAIVRCRAQVERALGDKIRRAESVSYQYLAMATAADGVAEGICHEIKQRLTKMKVRQADRMANELHFLMNTLKGYLSDDILALVDSTRRTLCSRAGRGGGAQGDGPDGLAALEELERLGRVYVLCLGESPAH